jgi:hypothetical protein
MSMTTEVRNRPILFSAPMVRAILADRKTQTRRIYEGFFLTPDKPCWHLDDAGRGGCPYGMPGDQMWVRETWAHPVPGCEFQGGVSYRADHIDPRGDGPAHPMKWRPSIHMPRWASRITLEITGVRVERLNAISHDDAIAEGVSGGCGPGYSFACYEFKQLWLSIHGHGSWDANPWVWVVEFRRVEGS